MKLRFWAGGGGTCILHPPLAIRPVAGILHRFAYITAMRLSEIPVADLRRQILYAPQPNFLHFHAVFRKKFGRIIDCPPPSRRLVHQWLIQDFPEVGAPTQKVDVKSYYLANFSPKTAWNWKNVDPEGGVFRSANVNPLGNPKFAADFVGHYNTLWDVRYRSTWATVIYVHVFIRKIRASRSNFNSCDMACVFKSINLWCCYGVSGWF